MIREAIATGETTQIAFEKACAELNVETTDAQIEVLEMPEKKFLGLFGKKDAKVRAYIEISPAQVARDYLADIIKLMGVNDVDIAITESESGAEFALTGKGINSIIGHHGETLDALQYLTGLVANHIEESYYRVTLNTGNYREKRETTLESLGKKMASKAVYTNKKYALEAMNPYERRIIHTAVQEVENATSWSEGEDANRHVVIGPADGVNARWGTYRPNNNFDRNSKDNRNRSSNGSRYNKPNNNGFKKNNNGFNKNNGYKKPYNNAKPYERINTTNDVKTEKPVVKTAPTSASKKTNNSATPLYGKIEKPVKEID